MDDERAMVMEAATRAAAAAEKAAQAAEAAFGVRDQVKAIHDRVFDGFPSEIREEMATAVEGVMQKVDARLKTATESTERNIGSLRSKLWAVLIGVALVLAGIVIEGRIDAGARSTENQRNYEAIRDLELKLELHLAQPTTPVPPAEQPGH